MGMPGANITIDVSRVVPEAREAVEWAGRVYYEHTRPWFVGLVLHGSAVKGGFIPRCSDIDFQLYLGPAAFTPEGYLPFATSAAIQRNLAWIDPKPFAYLQCYAYPGTLAEGQIGPVPGAYALLAGELPVPEATAEQLRESARRALDALDPVPGALKTGLLEHGDGKLERMVRLLCTDVWPVVYQIVAIQHDEPIRAWNLRKDAAIALLPKDGELHAHASSFHRTVRAYYPSRHAHDAAVTLLEHGVNFLAAAKAWWQQRRAQ